MLWCANLEFITRFTAGVVARRVVVENRERVKIKIPLSGSTADLLE